MTSKLEDDKVVEAIILFNSDKDAIAAEYENVDTVGSGSFTSSFLGRINTQQLQPIIKVQPEVETRLPEKFDASMYTMFAFPSGMRVTKKKENAFYHTFVRTREDGSKYFGVCWTKFFMVAGPGIEPKRSENLVLGPKGHTIKTSSGSLSPSQPIAIPKDHSKTRSKIYEALWAPSCICVISKYPYYQSMISWIRQYVSNNSVEGSSEAIDEITLARFYEIVAKCQHPFLRLPQQKSSHTPLLPPIDMDFTYLFRHMDPDNVWKIVQAILHERKILVLAELTHLGECIEALTSLLYPLEWPYNYVPLLPVAAVPFLESPLPFIMGLPKQSAAEIDQPPRDVIMVDVEKNLILDHEQEYFQKQNLHGKFKEILLSAIKQYTASLNSNYNPIITHQDPHTPVARVPGAIPQTNSFMYDYLLSESDEENTDLLDESQIASSSQTQNLSHSIGELQLSKHASHNQTIGNPTPAARMSSHRNTVNANSAPKIVKQPENPTIRYSAFFHAQSPQGMHCMNVGATSNENMALFHLRRSFICVWVSLLRNYRECCDSYGKVTFSVMELFKKREFLAAAKESAKDFLEKFIDGQIFSFFLEERLLQDATTTEEKEDIFDFYVTKSLERDKARLAKLRSKEFVGDLLCRVEVTTDNFVLKSWKLKKLKISANSNRFTVSEKPREREDTTKANRNMKDIFGNTLKLKKGLAMLKEAPKTQLPQGFLAPMHFELLPGLTEIIIPEEQPSGLSMSYIFQVNNVTQIPHAIARSGSFSSSSSPVMQHSSTPLPIPNQSVTFSASTPELRQKWVSRFRAKLLNLVTEMIKRTSLTPDSVKTISTVHQKAAVRKTLDIDLNSLFLPPSPTSPLSPKTRTQTRSAEPAVVVVDNSKSQHEETPVVPTAVIDPVMQAIVVDNVPVPETPIEQEPSSVAENNDNKGPLIYTRPRTRTIGQVIEAAAPRIPANSKKLPSSYSELATQNCMTSSESIATLQSFIPIESIPGPLITFTGQVIKMIQSIVEDPTKVDSHISLPEKPNIEFDSLTILNEAQNSASDPKGKTYNKMAVLKDVILCSLEELFKDIDNCLISIQDATSLDRDSQQLEGAMRASKVLQAIDQLLKYTLEGCNLLESPTPSSSTPSSPAVPRSPLPPVVITPVPNPAPVPAPTPQTTTTPPSSPPPSPKKEPATVAPAPSTSPNSSNSANSAPSSSSATSSTSSNSSGNAPAPVLQVTSPKSSKRTPTTPATSGPAAFKEISLVELYNSIVSEQKNREELHLTTQYTAAASTSINTNQSNNNNNTSPTSARSNTIDVPRATQIKEKTILRPASEPLQSSVPMKTISVEEFKARCSFTPLLTQFMELQQALLATNTTKYTEILFFARFSRNLKKMLISEHLDQLVPADFVAKKPQAVDTSVLAQSDKIVQLRNAAMETFMENQYHINKIITEFKLSDSSNKVVTLAKGLRNVSNVVKESHASYFASQTPS